MNREFKFRNWNGRRWLEVSPNMPYQNSDERCISQQFTGVLDKRGKEIYEGDLIKTDLVPETLEVLADLCSMYLMSNLNGGKTTFQRLDDVQSHHLLVVGNIFENPELLKI